MANVNNRVFVSGECVNISNVKLLFEGTGRDALTYKLHIETEPNEIKVVEFFTNKFKSNGDENGMYTGVETICNEVITRAETGKGEIVNCVCTLKDNTYYDNGEKVESYKIAGNFCNREKDGKKITPTNIFEVDALVESMEEVEYEGGTYLKIRTLVNEYKQNALYTEMRVYNKDYIDGLKSMYTVGSIGSLQGKFMEVETEQPTGFGTATKRTFERFLEITGGSAPYNTTVKDGQFVVTDITDTNDAFCVENIAAMRNKIQENLDKKLQKDASKRQISDDVVPF